MSTTTETSEKKKQEDVMSLITEWEKNPNWDLESTPGFEEWHDALYTYRIQKEDFWKDVKSQKSLRAAQSMGLPLSVYVEWKKFKMLSETHRSKANSMLAHIVYGTNKIDQEKQTIIEVFMDSLYRGAVNTAKAEIIADKFQYDGK